MTQATTPASNHRTHAFVYLFLIALAGPAAEVLDGSADPRWLSGLALAAFAACFILQVSLQHHDGGSGPVGGDGSSVRWQRRIPLILVMGAIATAATLVWGSQWLVLFMFVVVTAALLVPGRMAPLVIGSIAAAAVVVEVASGWDVVSATTAGSWALSIVMAGFVAALVRRRTLLIAELRATQGEVARLAAADAVADERLRFARDLHDLLGHSLSLIVLKAELARRLLERGDAGQQVRQEVMDLEEAARRSLVEVREAVAGYRARSFRAELDRGCAALAAADIEVTVTGDAAGDEVGDGRTDPVFPPSVDEVLAWVVREATTNVVRHSEARQVHIEVASGDGDATLQITDDGPEAREWDWLAAARSGSSGLLGLQERVAAAGGRFAAGPADGGGFRVTAVVPFDGTAGA
jgi:two-component system, NarL family, sensor histidine kinase DesK